MKVYKFVSWDVEPAQEITYESFILNYDKYRAQVNNALHGYLKIGGWLYDFREDLKQYLVKQRGGVARALFNNCRPWSREN